MRGTGGSSVARTSEAGSSNNPVERWDALRAGTSFSTSGSMPARSGISGTIDLQSPAPDAESPSSTDLPPKPASSTADSTDGSGRETGSSPASPSGSSEVSVPLKEATPDQVQAADVPADMHHDQVMALAHEAYESQNYDEADRLIGIAEERGASRRAVATARGYVRDARARALAASPPREAASGGGPSESDPSAGGMLVP
jgi:hypothetical protein